MVVPSLSALFSDSSRQLLSDRGPFLRPVLFNKQKHKHILFRRPWTFSLVLTSSLLPSWNLRILIQWNSCWIFSYKFLAFFQRISFHFAQVRAPQILSFVSRAVCLLIRILALHHPWARRLILGVCRTIHELIISLSQLRNTKAKFVF